MIFRPEVQAFINAQNLIYPLIKRGVKHFVVSPGFRNSPLLLSLIALKNKNEGNDIFIHNHIDERGAAFFALGLSKSHKVPAAVICTSGTALANYHPAVLEAYYSQTPLIVISADRPKELIGVGANQAMIQKDFFGKQIRMHQHIEAETDQSKIAQASLVAFAQATFPVPGPVHLNIAFREPFFVSLEEANSIKLPQIVLQPISPPALKALEFDRLAAVFNKAKTPILSLGPERLSKNAINLLKDLSEKLHAPLFVEKSSGASFHLSSEKLITQFDCFLRNKNTRLEFKPDCVLRIGAPLTSKWWNTWLDENNTHEFILDHIGETRNPGNHPASFIGLHLDSQLEEGLSKFLNLCQQSSSNEWKKKLHTLEEQSRLELTEYLQSVSTFTEWHLHQELSKLLPYKAQLFLGNSMAIRDFDAASTNNQNELNLFTNRGLSGIDGLIATSLGVAHKSSTHTFLLLGDLSALHDLNSLQLVRNLKIPFTVMVINNQGGEIFRLIKTAEEKAESHYFTAPQETNFKAIAQAFNLSYESISNTSQMKECFKQKTLPQFIEFFVDPQTNTQTRLNFWKRYQN